YKQDGRGYLNDKRLHVWVVDVESGERRRVTSEAVDYAFPLWSPDGTKLSAQVTTQNGMASQLAIIDAITGAEKRVGWDSGVIATWSWSPDGSRIIFAGDDARTWQHDFFIYD